MKTLALLAALALTGCTTATAGGFYSGGFYGAGAGGGGDVAADWTQIAQIDFTALDAQDLVASGDGDYVLSDGLTLHVLNTADGSLDILAGGAGLDFVRSASNGAMPLIGLEEAGWVASYSDSDLMRAVVRYDVANTNVATTNAYTFTEWSGNKSDATSAGHMKHTAQCRYDGSTYDIDGFTWDGAFRSTSQAGNVAGHPEYVMHTLHGPREATMVMGEAAAVPRLTSDFTTVDASISNSANPATTVGGVDPNAFSAASNHYLRFAGAGSYTDIRILSVTFYRFQ